MKVKFKSLLLSLALSLICLNANAVLINFDNVADGTVINNTYAAQGVTFVNPVGNADIYARASSTNNSAPNVVSVFGTGVPAFDARFGAVQANFSVAQGKVSIDAAILRLPEGLGTPVNAPRLEIYDTSNNFLLGVNWDFSVIPQPPAGGITAFQTLSFTSATNNIGSVRFFSGQPGGSPSNFGLFDNLVFERVGVTPSVPAPGSVALIVIGLLGLGFTVRRKI